MTREHSLGMRIDWAEGSFGDSGKASPERKSELIGLFSSTKHESSQLQI